MTSVVSADYFAANPYSERQVRPGADASSLSDSNLMAAEPGWRAGINTSEAPGNQRALKHKRTLDAVHIVERVPQDPNDAYSPGTSHFSQITKSIGAEARHHRTQQEINSNSKLLRIPNQPSINIGNINGNVSINFNN
jgi:hypothetical protein